MYRNFKAVSVLSKVNVLGLSERFYISWIEDAKFMRFIYFKSTIRLVELLFLTNLS